VKITFELRGRLAMRAAGATVTSPGAARTGSMTSRLATGTGVVPEGHLHTEDPVLCDVKVCRR
jgi:hypothetical protein